MTGGRKLGKFSNPMKILRGLKQDKIISDLFLSV